MSEFKLKREQLAELWRLRPILRPSGASVLYDPLGNYTEAPYQAIMTKEDWKNAQGIIDRAVDFRLRFTKLLESLSLMQKIPITNKKGPPLEVEGALSDSPKLPLPIAHSDFELQKPEGPDFRRYATTECNQSMVEAGARRVAETIEQHCLFGCEQGEFSFPGIFSMENARMVRFEAPAWETNQKVMAMVLQAKMGLMDDMHFGPYLPIHGNAWDMWMDSDYKPMEPQTLRDEIGKAEMVLRPMRLDFIPGLDMALVQVTPDVIRMVEVIRPTLIQVGEGKFMVIAIMVPQIRLDNCGKCGIVHMKLEVHG